MHVYCIYMRTHKHVLAYIMPRARVIKGTARAACRGTCILRGRTFYYYILVGSTSINSVISITSRRKCDSQKKKEKERKETNEAEL